jgi:hypothetical protein
MRVIRPFAAVAIGDKLASTDVCDSAQPSAVLFQALDSDFSGQGLASAVVPRCEVNQVEVGMAMPARRR